MEMDPVEKFELDGYLVEIHFDPDPESPREWSNLGTMRCWHSRYDLGDKTKGQECPDDPSEFVAWADSVGARYLPLYLYDHSGITMRTRPFSSRWDSGPVGYIYVLPQTIRDEYRVVGEMIPDDVVAKVLKQLEQEVATYDEFLTGQVFGYTITDADGEDVDSLWGIYGGLEYVRQEATDAVKSARARATELALTAADAAVQAGQDAWAMHGDS